MILLVLSWKEWITHVELVQNATKTPHVDCAAVGNTKYDLGGSIEARLDVCVYLLVLEAATAEVNDLYSGLVYLSKQDVFGFEVAVNDVVFSKVVKGDKDLDGEPLDEVEGEALKVVHLDELVKVH